MSFNGSSKLAKANSSFIIPHSSFVLVHLNPQLIRTLEERQTQHAGDHEIEVESQRSVDEHRRQISNPRKSKWREDDRHDDPCQPANQLHQQHQSKSLEIGATHTLDRIEPYERVDDGPNTLRVTSDGQRHRVV